MFRGCDRAIRSRVCSFTRWPWRAAWEMPSHEPLPPRGQTVMEIRRQEQRMEAARFLVVIADDDGIGPQTSRAILELAARGIVTGTVLLVNSPYAADAVRNWRQSGAGMEIGWHPCLTLDAPVAP